MVWTPPKTFVALEVLTASEMNTYVRDNLLALVEASPLIIPSARVYNNANISVPKNTTTVLTFNSERWDTGEIHSTVSNTGRLTCKTAGLHGIYGNVRFEANAIGSRIISIQLNGTDVIAHQRVPAVTDVDDVTSLSIYTEYVLAVNDYVELQFFQNSTTTLSVTYTAKYSPEFGMTYLGKVS